MTIRKTLIFLLLGIVSPVAAQDIFSDSARIRYARHLESSGDYLSAAEEWKYVYYHHPVSGNFTSLLRIYRLAGLHDSIISLTSQWLESKNQTDTARNKINSEKIYALASSGRLSPVNISEMNVQDSTILLFCSEIIKGDFIAAKKMMGGRKKSLGDKVKQDETLNDLLHELKRHRKVPASVAIGSSAVVPGSGKLILGRTIDGLLSFSVTVTNGVLAYYTYDKLGSNSAWPWLYCGVFAGFYAANIYGTAKLSKTEILFKQNKLKSHAKNYLHHYLFNR